MKTVVALLLLSVFLVSEFYQTNSFTFPSILDEAREALMPFSTGPSATPKPVKPVTRPSTRRRRTSRRRRRSISKGDKLGGIMPSFSVVGGGGSTPTFKLLPKRPARSKPSNNFLEILSKVERSLLEAQASGNRRTSLTKLTQSMKLAVKKKSYLFARETLGTALYAALTKGRRGKRSTVNPGKQYLALLKKKLGKANFNKLIGFDDDKSLIFAIDDTGSMSDEINAVKDIATSIVRSPAANRGVLNYILSVFNDPSVGPSYALENGNEFIKKLRNIRAHGGGDYPELTFTGIQRAMDLSPEPGSPMFVFTDATSKDHKKNKYTIIEAAKALDININFFTTGSAATFKPFLETARETCGMILRLHNSNEIRKLKSITELSLKNYACMGGGNGSGGRGRKRSLSKSHVITVDDSVDKMIVSVSTSNSNPVVTLRDPRGRVQTWGKISLYRAAIYELFNPIPGRWTLTVASSAGSYHYLVRGASKTNIDFDYYFVMIPTGRRKKVTIPISQPLKGQVARAILTVTGVEKIQPNTLKVDLIDKKTGAIIKTLSTTRRRRSKAHFMVSFIPPSKPFKMQIRGKTLSGNTFERSSRNTIKPLTALIRVYKAMNGQLALPRGRRMFVVMQVFNSGQTETFDVSLNDRFKYAVTRRKLSVKVYKNRNRRFIMWFSASRTAKPGKAYPVAVTIKGRRTGTETGQILNMIVT